MSAGGQRQSKPSFTDHLLGLDGFQIDTLVDISDVKETAPSPDWQSSATGRIAYWANAVTFYPTFISSLLASWRSAISFSRFYIKAKKMCEDASPDGVYGPTQQTSLNALWQTIRGPEIPIDHPETNASTKNLFEVVDRLLSPQSRREAPLGPIISLSLATVREPRLLSFFAQTGIPKRRRFLITKNGYIGLGPRETKVGDSIVILQGGRVPVVARRAASGHWRVVGESYIHGIMQGEAFDEDKCERLWFE
ncbi:MAG: hypothetical protein Q9157_006112 [Trypethelium eluteriae]